MFYLTSQKGSATLIATVGKFYYVLAIVLKLPLAPTMLWYTLDWNNQLTSLIYLGCNHRRFNRSNSNLAPTQWLSIFRFRIPLALATRSILRLLTWERLLLLRWRGGCPPQMGVALWASRGCCTSIGLKRDGHSRVTLCRHSVCWYKCAENFHT